MIKNIQSIKKTTKTETRNQLINQFVNQYFAHIPEQEANQIKSMFSPENKVELNKLVNGLKSVVQTQKEEIQILNSQKEKINSIGEN